MGLMDGTYRELHPLTTLRAFVLMLARIGAVILGLEAVGMTVEWLYHSDCHCMGKGKEVVLALQPDLAGDEERIRGMAARDARILSMRIEVVQFKRWLSIPPEEYQQQGKCVVVVGKQMLATTNARTAMWTAWCGEIQLNAAGYTESALLEEFRHLQAGHHCLPSQVSAPVAGLAKLIFDDALGVVRINNWTRAVMAGEKD